MKEKLGFMLSVICIAAVGLLAGANISAKHKILAQTNPEEEASLREVLPEAVRFEPVKMADTLVYYRAFDTDGKLIGAAFRAYGKGYLSTIETMAGMTLDGTITAIKVLRQNETSSLGARVTKPEFTRQFGNRAIADLNKVQAITGATVSSRAVIESVNEKAREVKPMIDHDLLAAARK